MTQTNFHDTIALHAPAAARQFTAHGGAGGAHSDGEVVFIFNAHGRTRYCSDPERFAADGRDLIDTAIADLIPDLPLRENTPGYNIAYVRMSFAEAQWQAHKIRTADRRFLPAEICLKPIALDRSFCLLGLVRLHEAQAERALSIARPARLRGAATHRQRWPHHAHNAA